MDKISLQATLRNSEEVRAKDLRAAGRIPVELYGHGVPNKSLSVEYQEFRKAYAKAGQSTLIELHVDKEKFNVMVHEVSYNPIYDTFDHIDLKAVSMKEKVHAYVKLNFIGVSKAVKDLGGILNTALEELEIKCLPIDLVHHIDVDISKIEDFHTAIHVGDLELTKSDKYEVLHELTDTIASVSAPAAPEEETAGGDVDVSSVMTAKDEERAAKEAEGA